MSSALSLELQQAIAAAHAGDKDQARLLADRVIQDDPENENALYLMSALVESDEEREAYLSQILIVNPEHGGAQKYLAELDEPTILSEDEIIVTSDDLGDEFDYLEETVVVGSAAALSLEDIQDITPESEMLIDEEISESVPDWLLDEEEVVDEALTGTEGDTDIGDVDQVPDWLTDEPSPAALEEEQVEQLVEEKPVPIPVKPAPQPKQAAQKGPSDRVLSIILILLMLVAVAIVAGIIFLAVSRPFLS